jgi:hypothetical protein
VVVAVSAPVTFEPAAASAPLQPPEAVQLVALDELHCRVVAPPWLTDAGLADSVIDGAGVDTVTVTDCEAEPPLPVQVKVNLALAVNAGVLAEPAVASLPFQPPDALQEVAFVEFQLKLEVAPLFTVVGLADKVTVGVGLVTEIVTTCEALPPEPEQMSE